MSEFNTIAIDLAKSVFQLCVISNQGKSIKSLRLNRTRFQDFMANRERSRIVMEACYSSHYWGRYFEKAGHEVLLIPAQHVTPFVRGNKNDKNDALAIYEASLRPNIRFVPIKAEYQQDIQCLHRMRERLVANRTSLCNQLRGLLADYGHIFPVGINAIIKGVREIIRDSSLSGSLLSELESSIVEYDYQTKRIDKINKVLKSHSDKNPHSQRLMQIPGIGAHIATAITSTVGKAEVFKNARDFAAWTGLTPRQSASGNKSVMGGITKRGDQYLRKLLVQAARHTVRWAVKESDSKLAKWINEIIVRRGLQKGVVAVAHKLARIIWCVLTREEGFKPA